MNTHYKFDSHKLLLIFWTRQNSDGAPKAEFYLSKRLLNYMLLLVLILSCNCIFTKKPRFPSSPVNEAHGMDPVQGQHNLSRVKASPFLWYIVIAHQVHQVPTRHVFHHHVEVAVVLECKEELQDRT